MVYKNLLNLAKKTPSELHLQIFLIENQLLIYY